MNNEEIKTKKKKKNTKKTGSSRLSRLFWRNPGRRTPTDRDEPQRGGGDVVVEVVVLPCEGRRGGARGDVVVVLPCDGGDVVETWWRRGGGGAAFPFQLRAAASFFYDIIPRFPSAYSQMYSTFQ